MQDEQSRKGDGVHCECVPWEARLAPAGLLVRAKGPQCRGIRLGVPGERSLRLLVAQQATQDTVGMGEGERLHGAGPSCSVRLHEHGSRAKTSRGHKNLAYAPAGSHIRYEASLIAATRTRRLLKAVPDAMRSPESSSAFSPSSAASA